VVGIKGGEMNCPYCGGDKEIRNPTGYCDHLYYPDNCQGNKKAFEQGRIAGLKEAVGIVVTDAVSVTATPKVGEKFDIEKYNYANELLNKHTIFITEAIEAKIKEGE